ncbi:MAG: DEAD/DEAH box helicase, partial [Rikenellaceae bacterium]
MSIENQIIADLEENQTQENVTAEPTAAQESIQEEVLEEGQDATVAPQNQLLPNFAELGLSENILEAIKHKGFEQPSPIQKLSIPVLLRDTNDI